MAAKTTPALTRIRSATRWAILGESGLYTGQWFTRQDAIWAHVEARGMPTVLDGVVNGFMVCETEADCAKAWAYWRQRGDRAVKVTITWEEPL
jgi:hypothetical protein